MYARSKKVFLNFLFIKIFYIIISFFNNNLVFSVASVKGSLGIPKLYPIIFKAAFTGIGLTSENKAEIRGIKSICAFCASFIFPF